MLDIKEGLKLMIERKLSYDECHKEINGVLHKLCKICEEWFPCDVEHFYKSSSNVKDGLFPYCKVCWNKQTTEWGKENVDKKRGYYRKNNKTETTKQRKYLFSKYQRESGYRKEWELNNPDKIKSYHDIYSNKKHTISKKEWLSCKEYFNNRCAYCELPIEEHYNKFRGELRLTDLHREHVDCNGESDLSNCIPSCKDCNSSKHNSKLEVWYNENNINFSQDRLNKIYKWLKEDYKLYIQEPKNNK